MATKIDLKNIKPSSKNKLVMPAPFIKTPYKSKVSLIFADFTASGRPSPIIEEYINTKVLPYYSNTHSNAYCGIRMKQMINDTKQYMRKIMNIDTSKKIIFTGSGTTCAINHLVYCLNLTSESNINIYLTPFEHHSNYLPWIEAAKHNQNIHVKMLDISDNFIIKIDSLTQILKSSESNQLISSNITYTNIFSISACSNVLGIKQDIKLIYQTINQYNKPNDNNNIPYGKRNLLFVDYACSGPYTPIDAAYVDALFFSPHKFIGGTATPGVLIANKELFHNDSPYTPGGGCVKKVCSQYVQYYQDIEKREMAGTPNIVGIIRIKPLLLLKETFKKIIEHNEHHIAQYVFCQMAGLEKRYPNLTVIESGCQVANRLPIVCCSVKDIHYNLIVVLMNDLFGIQTRGGVSCTGILAEIIEQKYNIKGWCRITFNWLMDQAEIDYIIGSLGHIIENIDKYKMDYQYDEDANLFTHKSSK